MCPNLDIMSSDNALDVFYYLFLYIMLFFINLLKCICF